MAKGRFRPMLLLRSTVRRCLAAQQWNRKSLELLKNSWNVIPSSENLSSFRLIRDISTHATCQFLITGQKFALNNQPINHIHNNERRYLGLFAQSRCSFLLCYIWTRDNFSPIISLLISINFIGNLPRLRQTWLIDSSTNAHFKQHHYVSPPPSLPTYLPTALILVIETLH